MDFKRQTEKSTIEYIIERMTGDDFFNANETCECCGTPPFLSGGKIQPIVFFLLFCDSQYYSHVNAIKKVKINICNHCFATLIDANNHVPYVTEALLKQPQSSLEEAKNLSLFLVLNNRHKDIVIKPGILLNHCIWMDSRFITMVHEKGLWDRGSGRLTMDPMFLHSKEYLKFGEFLAQTPEYQGINPEVIFTTDSRTYRQRAILLHEGILNFVGKTRVPVEPLKPIAAPREDYRARVHNYSYKPQLVIFTKEEESNEMLIGFENEVSYEVLKKEPEKKEITEDEDLLTRFLIDQENNYGLQVRRNFDEDYVSYLAGICHQQFSKKFLENFVYFKNDSSAGNGQGFEIVSHPMSRTFFEENRANFKDVYEKLSETKELSSGTGSNCGLHFHVSKRNISQTVLANLGLFLTLNRQFILSFSRRNEVDLDHWAKLPNINQLREIINPRLSEEEFEQNIHNKLYTKKELQAATLAMLREMKTRVGRKMALNTCPRHTLEFRFLKGTLNPTNFISSAEFIFALIDFCKKPAEFGVSAFLKYIFNPIRADNYPYLVDKLSRITMTGHEVYKIGDK